MASTKALHRLPLAIGSALTSHQILSTLRISSFQVQPQATRISKWSLSAFVRVPSTSPRPQLKPVIVSAKLSLPNVLLVRLTSRLPPAPAMTACVLLAPLVRKDLLLARPAIVSLTRFARSTLPNVTLLLSGRAPPPTAKKTAFVPPSPPVRMVVHTSSRHLLKLQIVFALLARTPVMVPHNTRPKPVPQPKIVCAQITQNVLPPSTATQRVMQRLTLYANPQRSVLARSGNPGPYPPSVTSSTPTEFALR